MTRKPKLSTVTDLLPAWTADVLSGEPPVVWTHGLPAPRLSPGTVTLIGAPPSVGKTALVMQLVVEAIRNDGDLHATVANVEMAPGILLERQLARLSGVPASTIRDRILRADEKDRLQDGIDTIAAFGDRLAFVSAPYTLANVADACDRHGSQIVVLDYLQRFGGVGEHADDRTRVNELMDYLRRFAGCGMAVIAVSAVGRSRDRNGRSGYDDLNLASYRGSGELEFGADDAYIMAAAADRDSGRVRLEHLKARNGDLVSLDLLFDRAHQSFTIDHDPPARDEPEPARRSRRSCRRAPRDDDATPPELLARAAAARERQAAARTGTVTTGADPAPTEDDWNVAMLKAVSAPATNDDPETTTCQ
jgi:replicative DNA helicase